jgi:hypothetical protein
MWVTWLNAASLEFGGRLVAPLPVQYVPLPTNYPFNSGNPKTLTLPFLSRDREEFAYFADKLWEKDYIDHEKFIELENTPRSEWPRRTADSFDCVTMKPGI